MTELHKRARQVMAAGEALGLDVRVREFGQDEARTAADAARSLGCEVDQIVKSLVFVVDTAPVLVLCSGGRRVDVVKVGNLFGSPAVRKADAAEVRAATGFAVGGIPPFGHTREMTVLMDGRLEDFATVWAAAGTPRHVFPLTPDELRKATGAALADVTLDDDIPG
jgi:prolyl-tRNA editing enzyme YbaK/EbsC (Cys-tRNA(Pro) deacylase)